MNNPPPKLPKPAARKRSAGNRWKAVKPRRPPRQIERQEQAAFFAWAAYLPDLRWMFHIPNGGHRDPRTAAILTGQGVKPGIPDVFLPIARGGYFGLFVEMKAPGGSTTPSQNDAALGLSGAGYLCVVAEGFIPAKRIIEWYLAQPLTIDQFAAARVARLRPPSGVAPKPGPM